ncbi:FMN-binding glutamate synthase family protein [Tropicimonas sp. IMCC6043]|uniref:FMN-binding glutamate synthase family protein n=1 Tax=Tropicimonas sp. IMCC6043 TaxID=2510645 RepID=UPI00101CA446|nr:FMN-binding glutamate synthase family protein [Tropicimonas sp. IMCC6043]RYH11323.1 FMN-binding glutamate synthase family protein [Tropicimonas sp. IMCC6043]
MPDLLKRAIIPLLAALLAAVALAQGWIWLALPALAIVALGIYDFSQTRWTITRNYPVAGRIRWLFYKLRPYLHAYIVEDDLSGTPYSFEARNLIHSRARGETGTQPFGTERDVESAEYHWVGHSIAAKSDPDTSPRVTVGNDQCSRPYSASILNISAMSFGALSANAVRALNRGAALGGFYHDTGEGGISPYHLEHGGDLVWELGSGYFGARDKDGRFDPESFRDGAARETVRMTEIKLSQGAKPGHGGLLPAAKVTEEIAGIRKIPAHRDCLSPRAHSAFSTPIELMEFAAKLRDLSGGKPVGLKLCIGHPHEPFALVKAMLETGIRPDFIVVDGGEGGTGAAPLELSDWVGMPLSEGLVLMRNALVGAGLKEHVRLAASGKVYSGMGLARAIAQGADWCNAARAFMLSIGCIQAQRCHLGTCPTGVTTQSAGRQRGLVPEVQGERAAQFHARTLEALADIVASAGFKHPAELEPHHLMHRVGPERAVPMDRVHTFLARGVLIDAPEETIYADWWKAAQADSFRPAIDLVSGRARTRTDQTEM